jgi:formylglycine-generating enzyme required for sulfatase activity
VLLALFLACPSDMVAVPAAKIAIGTDYGDGDERPRHIVDIGAFCLDRTEVTVNDYTRCTTCDKSTLLRWQSSTARQREVWQRFCTFEQAGHGLHPMNCVDYDSAAMFCASTHKRLPRQEEWEYAALGGRAQQFPWGNAEPSGTLVSATGGEAFPLPLGEAWKPLYDHDGFVGTAPVGSFPAGASPFGALDMAGNVWEWTSSPYCAYGHLCATDLQVIRGGSFVNDSAWLLRGAHRHFAAKNVRMHAIGFRCAR